MFGHTPLHSEGYVKGPTRRHSTTNARHGYRGNIVHADVRCWLGNEHEGLVEAEQVAFVGFDRTLDTGLLVMADEVS